MATAVVSGASVQCTMGMAPGQLLVTSQATVLAGGMPAATVTDAAPMTNVTPCGMCTSLANPQVAAHALRPCPGGYLDLCRHAADRRKAGVVHRRYTGVFIRWKYPYRLSWTDDRNLLAAYPICLVFSENEIIERRLVLRQRS